MNYELMLVVNPTVDVDPVISRLEKSVGDTGATAVKVNKLGRKPLAYQIAKHTEGEYVLFNFEAEGEAVGAISKRLRLEQEALLRYLIIKAKTSKIAKITETGASGKEDRGAKVTVKTVSSREKQAVLKEKKKPSKVKKQKVTKKGRKK